MGNLYNIPSIKEYQKKGMSKIFIEHLKSGWTFEKFYEKMILIILVWLGLWKLLDFFI